MNEKLDRGEWIERRAAGWSDRVGQLTVAALLFLLLTGLSIYVLPFSVFNQHAVLVHTLVGVLFILPAVVFCAKHVAAYARYPSTHVKFSGYAATGLLLACTVSGLVLTWQGALGTRITYVWRTTHILTTFGLLLFFVAHLAPPLLRALGSRSSEADSLRPAARGYLRFAGGGLALMLLATAALTLVVQPLEMNDTFPEGYDEQPYADAGPFSPSLAMTSTGGALDARSFAGSESCGASGCHEEIYAEWLPSAHRFASLDAGFQAIQGLMAKQNGAVSTRYCGGCHDPISLFSGTKNIGVDQLTSLDGYQEGISCLACHAIKQTDVSGNANYVIERPERYVWEQREGEMAGFLSNFLLRTYPDHHVETLSRRMFKTPEFCAACHKQFIDEEVNKVGWVQLQNQFDNWRASRWFDEERPERTVECRECHMPLMASNDPAAGDEADSNRSADDGKHRSHSFLGANQFIPVLQELEGAEEHVAAIDTWLRGEYEIPEIASKWSSGPAVPIEIDVPATVIEGEDLEVVVHIINNKVGHDFPTGPLDIIQAWVHVEVTDANGVSVFHSGRVNEGRAQLHRDRQLHVQGRARRPLRQPDRPPQPVGDGGRALQALPVPRDGGGHVLLVRVLGSVTRGSRRRLRRTGQGRDDGSVARALDRRGEAQLPQVRPVPAQLRLRRGRGPDVAHHGHVRGAGRSHPARTFEMSARLWRRRRKSVLIGLGLLITGGILLVQFLSNRVDDYEAGERPDGLVDRLEKGPAADHPPVTFTEIAAQAGLRFRHFPATRSNRLPEDMGSGVALGDVNGDGLTDAFLVNLAGAMPAAGDDAPDWDRDAGRSRLFLNRKDGSFVDATQASGIDLVALANAAAFCDVDSDGDLDLFVTTYGTCRLFINDGAAHFQDASAAAGLEQHVGFWTGVAVADYNRDGAMDVYVCGYVVYDEEGKQRETSSSPYGLSIPALINPSSFEPERNLLLAGNGDGTFREVSVEAGVADAKGRGLGALFCDLNADGLPDLYVANDVSDNALLLNRGDGTFTDRTAQALVGDYRGAMGLAVGDYDGDLDLDLFITHWVAQENALYARNEALVEDGLAVPLYFDEADRYGLGHAALSMVGWATRFFDYDNDGLLDLFVVNGSTIPLPEDPDQLEPMRSQLFWRSPEKRHFFEVGAQSVEAFSTKHVGRGGATFDYDLDGDQDLVIVVHGGDAMLLRNDGGNDKPAVLVQLRQPEGNRYAIGARVLATIGDRQHLELVGTQGSYLSQHTVGELSLGLGDSAVVDRIEVTWPDGERLGRRGPDRGHVAGRRARVRGTVPRLLARHLDARRVADEREPARAARARSRRPRGHRGEEALLRTARQGRERARRRRNALRHRPLRTGARALARSRRLPVLPGQLLPRARPRVRCLGRLRAHGRLRRTRQPGLDADRSLAASRRRPAPGRHRARGRSLPTLCGPQQRAVPSDPPTGRGRPVEGRPGRSTPPLSTRRAPQPTVGGGVLVRRPRRLAGG